MIERMEISKEDKQSLVEQIVGFCGSRPLVYLKFTSCEEYANDILNGKLYANTPKYFRELELQSGERGQGDRFELENIIEATEFMMTDFETNEVIMKGTGGSLSIQYKDDENLPLVSLVGIPLEEMDLAYADENHANFLFPFSGEEYEKMSEKFGEYCVIIDGKELDRRIINYAEENNCDYIFDKIEYCYQNTLDRIISFQKGTKERFLFKNPDLSYQREYRIAFPHKLPEDHFINIGKLEKATVVKSDKLKTIGYTIYYDSHRKDDK